MIIQRKRLQQLKEQLGQQGENIIKQQQAKNREQKRSLSRRSSTEKGCHGVHNYYCCNAFIHIGIFSRQIVVNFNSLNFTT